MFISARGVGRRRKRDTARWRVAAMQDLQRMKAKSAELDARRNEKIQEHERWKAEVYAKHNEKMRELRRKFDTTWISEETEIRGCGLLHRSNCNDEDKGADYSSEDEETHEVLRYIKQHQ